MFSDYVKRSKKKAWVMNVITFSLVKNILSLFCLIIYSLFTFLLLGCPKAKTATIILRGGGEQFLEETERSVHDAIMIVKRTLAHKRVVAGGGAIEIELSTLLREYSRTIAGKQQLIINSFAKALEVIPRQVAENAGLDSIEILNKLRKEHVISVNGEGKWIGVDVLNEGICDTYISGVWEPSANKLNSIAAATEAACCILSIDETVRNPTSEKPGAASQGVGLGQGKGQNRMVSEAMGGGGMAGMMGGGRGRKGVKMFRGKVSFEYIYIDYYLRINIYYVIGWSVNKN